MRIKSLAPFLLVAIFSACSAAVTVTPTGIDMGPREPLEQHAKVPIYEAGDTLPNRSSLPIAVITLSGNAYADMRYLKKRLQQECRPLAPDFIYIYGVGSSYGGSITSYGGGLATSTPYNLLALSAGAMVWAPVRIGIYRDEDTGKVADTIPGGPADVAGIKIGDRILSIAGLRLSIDKLNFDRAISKMRPGVEVEFEILSPDGDRRTVTVIPEPNGQEGE